MSETKLSDSLGQFPLLLLTLLHRALSSRVPRAVYSLLPLRVRHCLLPVVCVKRAVGVREQASVLRGDSRNVQDTDTS